MCLISPLQCGQHVMFLASHRGRNICPPTATAAPITAVQATSSLPDRGNFWFISNCESKNQVRFITSVTIYECKYWIYSRWILKASLTFSALFSASVFIPKPITLISFCNLESGMPLSKLTFRISASWQQPCARSKIFVLANPCFLPDVVPTGSNFSRRIVSILRRQRTMIESMKLHQYTLNVHTMYLYLYVLSDVSRITLCSSSSRFTVSCSSVVLWQSAAFHLAKSSTIKLQITFSRCEVKHLIRGRLVKVLVFNKKERDYRCQRQITVWTRARLSITY